MPATSSAVLHWHGNKLKAKVQRWQRRVMIEALSVLLSTVKELISRPNLSGNFPSNPGEPPKAVTTELWKSYTLEMEPRGDKGQVQTTADHAVWLEFGTIKMAPRPHFRVAVRKAMPAMRKIAKQQPRF